MIKGMAHITGGGITDNLPRVLPPGTAARVNRTSWRVPAIFRWLGESGRVPEYDLRRALNMGIGMILVVAAKDADAVRKDLLERRRSQQRRDRRYRRRRVPKCSTCSCAARRYWRFSIVAARARV